MNVSALDRICKLNASTELNTTIVARASKTKVINRWLKGY